MSEFINLTVITMRLKKEVKDNIAKSFMKGINGGKAPKNRRKKIK